MSARSKERWRQRLREMASYREVLLRFPVVIAWLMAATFVANLLIEEIGPADATWRVLVGLACAAAAALSATLGFEAVTRRREVIGPRGRQLAAAIAGACGFCLVWFQDALHTSTWLLAFALVALIPVAPYLAGGSGEAFRGLLGRLTFALLLSAIGWSLLGGGISLVLVSLNLLFGLEVPFELYAHLAAMTALLLAPLFWLALIPRRFDLAADCRLDTLSARAVSVLGEWVAAPLILVYAVILHVYAAKCLLVGALPSGQSGWLVSGFGICLVTVLVICRPFMRETRVLTGAFLRYWPWLLPVPLLLLTMAVTLRIGAYGVTPERYLLAALALVLAIIAALQSFPRWRGDIRPMAAIPVLAMLLASFGPQGAEWTSIRSQSERFLAIVEQPARNPQQAGEALAALGYLRNVDALARAAPAGAKLSNDTSSNGTSSSEEAPSLETVARAWGLEPSTVGGAGSGSPYFSRVYSGAAGIALEGFDLLLSGVDVSAGRVAEVPLPSGQVLRLQLEGRALRISSANTTSRFDLPPEVTAISSGPDSEPELITLRQDGVRLGLVLETVSGSHNPEPTLDHLSATILVNAKEWR
ncbi:DUF4153 domain-containing protein [Salinicola socius]|uniref:DUF4153 domain-containing protein n=1 Tax=Salinicola socius TaxID=404433 RepID=A0A1Q8SWS8_9GAMM|nr:DUF4153 domain-containing protein [Salinicola socius]OLO05889.1 hypothetical protein BTW07_02865 [Salinicola socius]